MSIVTTLTPNGTGIKFQSHRPRRYWLRANATAADLLDDDGWGKPVTSVTQALGVLDKPALPWWGMEIGIAGILEAVARGAIRIEEGDEDEGGYRLKIFDQKIIDDPELLTDVKRLAKVLTREKLTVNHVRDAAGDRGHDAHSAFETYFQTGVLPEPTAFPEEQRGYIRSMRQFFESVTIGEVHTEIMVGSLEHRFAGRYDVRCELDGRWILLDLKTSKSVYASHKMQLEGYEGAGLECGWPATEARLVIHASADGSYDPTKNIVKSDAEYEDFLAAVHLQQRIKRLGGL